MTVFPGIGKMKYRDQAVRLYLIFQQVGANIINLKIYLKLLEKAQIAFRKHRFSSAILDK